MFYLKSFYSEKERTSIYVLASDLVYSMSRRKEKKNFCKNTEITGPSPIILE